MSKETVQPKDMMSEKELAIYWRITTNTIQKWRAASTGPFYIRYGGKIFYPRESIEDFEKKNLYKGISEKLETSEA